MIKRVGWMGAAVWLATGCSPATPGDDGGSGPMPDRAIVPDASGADARPDVAPGMDSGLADAGRDAAAEAGRDDGPDASREAGVDSGPRDAVGSDAAPDAGADTATDAGVAITPAWDAALVAECCTDSDAGLTWEPDWVDLSWDARQAIAIANTDSVGYGKLFVGALNDQAPTTMRRVPAASGAGETVYLSGRVTLNGASGFYSPESGNAFLFTQDQGDPSGLPEVFSAQIGGPDGVYVQPYVPLVEYIDNRGMLPLFEQYSPSYGNVLLFGPGLVEPYDWVLNCNRLQVFYRNCTRYALAGAIAYDYGSGQYDVPQLMGGAQPRVLSTTRADAIGFGPDGLHLWWIEGANWSDPLVPGGTLYQVSVDVSSGDAVPSAPERLGTAQSEWLAGSINGYHTAYLTKDPTGTRAQLVVHYNLFSGFDATYDLPVTPRYVQAIFAPDDSSIAVFVTTATDYRVYYAPTDPTGATLTLAYPPVAPPPTRPDGTQLYPPFYDAVAGDHTLLLGVLHDPYNATLNAVDMVTGAAQVVGADINPDFWSTSPDYARVAFVDVSSNPVQYVVADARPPYTTTPLPDPGVAFDSFYNPYWVGPEHVTYLANAGSATGLIAHGVDGSGGWVSGDVGAWTFNIGWPTPSGFESPPQPPAILYFERSPSTGLHLLAF